MILTDSTDRHQPMKADQTRRWSYFATSSPPDSADGGLFATLRKGPDPTMPTCLAPARIHKLAAERTTRYRPNRGVAECRADIDACVAAVFASWRAGA